jgi:hypothetical protein
MTILDTLNIAPIILLRGNNEDTGTTGQGCVMNVIAYLNGEDQITDQSECVCYVIRPLFIWFNDFLKDQDRKVLIPYIFKAMGSATKDRVEIHRRLSLIVGFAKNKSKYAVESAAESAAESAESAADYAVKWAESAAEFAAESAVKWAESAAESAAKYAAKYAAEYAAESAEYAAKSAAKSTDMYAAYYEKTKSEFLLLLDEYFPKSDGAIDPIVQHRLENFIALSIE